MNAVEIFYNLSTKNEERHLAQIEKRMLNANKKKKTMAQYIYGKKRKEKKRKEKKRKEKKRKEKIK